MNCPRCLTELPPGFKFCKECGAKIEPTCSQCGKTIPPDSKFCPECGQDLRKPPDTARIDTASPAAYTPKHLADKILTGKSAIEGERKIVTILFADVAGSTAVFENLDPEAVHEIMDGCFRILLDEVHRFEGTVNQFTGDGVMALFGAPIAHEDHAQRACHAALAIQKALTPYRESLKSRFGIEFAMRIGLHSGAVVVGAIGDDLRMDYTAQGDTANLAARMQAASRPNGILASQVTCRMARAFFEFQALQAIEVKGKQQAQQVYELVGPGRAETRMEAAIGRGLTPFVGRQKELAILTQAYEKAVKGHGQVVSIAGEAGVGKSRLLLEFTRSLTGGPHLLLTGQCLQFGRKMPYLPILGMLRSYFGLKDQPAEELARQRVRDTLQGLDPCLGVHLASFQSLLSLTVEEERYRDLDPKGKRDQDIEALRALWMRESQRQPLVLVVEDLHWVDKSSERFWDLFIGGLAGASILLVLVYRPEYNPSWTGKSYYQQIGLDQLPTTESVELVAAILEGGRVDPELNDLIMNRAAGNPLFMEEFTQNLLEKGAIRREADRFTLASAAGALQVPDTVQGIIAARLDRLEENLKSTLQVAAVIGRDFAYRLLQSVMGVRDELRASLINLQGLELIYEKSLFPELAYIFKHAMTQEVAYQSLLAKNRQRIHEQIGFSIETLYADQLEEYYILLAHHYGHSQNLEKAYTYLSLAGLQAQGAFANEEALAYFGKAWELVGQTIDPQVQQARRIQTGVRIAEVLEPLGRFEQALEVLREITDPDDPGNPDPRLARAYFFLGNNHSNLGNWSVARQHLATAIELARRADDHEVLGLAYHYLGQLDFFTCRFRSGLQHFKKAAALFEALDNPFWLSWVYAWVSVTVSFYRCTPLADIGKAEQWVQRAGNKRAGIFVHHAWFFYFMFNGDYQNARAHARQAAASAAEINEMIQAAASASFEASACWAMGLFQEGVERAGCCIGLSDKTGMKLVAANGLIFLAKNLIGLGRLDEADLSLSRAMAIAQALDLGLVKLWGFGARAQLLAGRKDPDRALIMQTLGQGLPILMRSRAWGLLLTHSGDRAAVFLALGDREPAAREIARIRRIKIKIGAPENSESLRLMETRLAAMAH